MKDETEKTKVDAAQFMGALRKLKTTFFCCSSGFPLAFKDEDDGHPNESILAYICLSFGFPENRTVIKFYEFNNLNRVLLVVV